MSFGVFTGHVYFRYFLVAKTGRLLQIINLSPISAWRHLPTATNLADVGTRIVACSNTKKD